MEQLILLGGGGHCKSCIDVIEQEGRYEIVGILDTQDLVGTKVLDYEIIGTDEDIEAYVVQGCSFLITVGQIKSAKIRQKLSTLLESKNAKIATVVSPRAYISKYASIGKGTIIMHDALINTAVSVGKHCIINTKALIEHDVVIEDLCHISTGAILNGGVHVKEGTFIGSNAVSKEYVTTEKNDFIKAGSIYKGES